MLPRFNLAFIVWMTMIHRPSILYTNSPEVFSLVCLFKASCTTSLFNSSRRLTLYVVYFTIPRHLFYQQKIRQLLWFWWKSRLEYTKYSISPLPPKLLQGRALNPPFWWKRATVLHYPPTHPHTSLQQRRCNGVMVFLQAPTLISHWKSWQH